MLGVVGDALGTVEGALGVLAEFAEPLGWLSLGLFLTGVLLEYYDREYARPVLAGGWVVFALFWLTLVYPWFTVDQSIIRGVGATVAVPLSALVAKTLYEGRDSLFTLSRAVTIMGLVYAPFVTIRQLREWLTLTVVDHTGWAMGLLGYNPPVVTRLSEVSQTVDREVDVNRSLLGPEGPKEFAFENTFVFVQGDGGTITYTIIIACTGIGSIAVMMGLIGAVRAPLRRKLRALAVAVPVIYVLNIVRNVFISVNFGKQYMNIFPDATMMLFGLDNELRVSYIWADRILAQSASVVAMVFILWLVLREVPEVIEPVEDVLFLLTGNEYDLASALDMDVERATADPAD
jgi:archaeosortase A (PGF-CTERM-specific)